MFDAIPFQLLNRKMAERKTRPVNNSRIPDPEYNNSLIHRPICQRGLIEDYMASCASGGNKLAGSEFQSNRETFVQLQKAGRFSKQPKIQEAGEKHGVAAAERLCVGSYGGPSVEDHYVSEP
jgi:hypothetical protein